MTAAESKATQPQDMAPAFGPAPFLHKCLAVGTAAGMRIEGPNLHVAVARVRPTGATNSAAFTIRDFRTRPAEEVRAEYRRELEKHGVSHVSATVLLPRSE